MQTEKFNQTMSDSTEIAVTRWIPEGDAKAVVVMVHGMLEHSLRYDRVGCMLAESGFVFSAHDMRGHGKTAFTAQQKGSGDFGVLARKDGFNKVVSDLNEIIGKIKEDFPGKKIVLFGHSFGSFVSQAYIERYNPSVDACVLCGSSGPMKIAKSGKRFVNFMLIFHGREFKSSFAQKVIFSRFLKRIPNVKTGFEWLSANTANIDMYLNDSWCGGVASLGFFHDMFSGIIDVHKPENMKKIPSDLPIFIISGEEDPVSNYGETVKNLAEIYKANGAKSVELKLYAGDRHEILNEKDGDDVLGDVEKWISSL